MIEASLSEKVLMYNQIDKWDGVMPKVTNGNNGNLMIDIPIEEKTQSVVSDDQNP